MEGDELETDKAIETDSAPRLAIDIGGSLVKIVYFSSDASGSSFCSTSDRVTGILEDGSPAPVGGLHQSFSNGRLHFYKFETGKINECLEFISSVLLPNTGSRNNDATFSSKCVIKATGGGAFKFADAFKEKLGITLDKVDEMDCLVAGVNFLLRAWNHEAFTYVDGQREYIQIDHNDLYPYLLVNIGSGVSMIKVDSDDKYQRVSGTSIGGGTFWGLGKLLTKCKSFNELLEMSHQGNNRLVDMLVGEIYGGMDYAKIGLTSTAIASSFGKPVSQKKELEDYQPEDMARSLLRMISNNVAQIAYLNALHFKLKRIFFGGFFICGHPYTMDTISVGVNYWSNGEAKAMFLGHEGFLGALGAFLSYSKNGLAEPAYQLSKESH